MKSKRYKVIGDIPGNPIFIGSKKLEKTLYDFIEYDENYFNEDKNINFDIFIENSKSNKVKWLNVSGIHDSIIINNICKEFNIHNLNVEDILNTSHRPKIEIYDTYTLVIIKILNFEDDVEIFKSEQLSIILTENTIITLRENKTGFFEPLRDRIRNTKGKIRTKNADYLLFAIIDLIFDHYINIVEQFGDKLNDLENEIINNQTNKTLLKIYNFKKEINILRKYIKPSYDIILNINKSDINIIEQSTKPFVKDLSDIIIHINDKIESYSNILNDFLNLYHTNSNNRMNEIMKVMTIFASIFIPLTFLAGIYGMNFDFLPELHFKYSYPIFWVLVIFVIIGMLLFFKKKKWL